MSGKKIWQTKVANFASNFVVISGTIYAITTEPAIVAIDAVTGQPVGRMTFSGGTLDTKNGPEYWLLVNESKIFVYFHDSQELIAFERR